MILINIPEEISLKYFKWVTGTSSQFSKLCFLWVSLIAQSVKNLPAMKETWV